MNIVSHIHSLMAYDMLRLYRTRQTSRHRPGPLSLASAHATYSESQHRRAAVSEGRKRETSKSGQERVKERDEWRSKALLGREEVIKANKERRETFAELDSTTTQLNDMRTNYQKLLGELETSKKLLDGEIAARNERGQERRRLQEDLHQLRNEVGQSKTFGKQLLELAARLNDDGSA